MFMAISRYEKLVNTIVNGIYVSDYKRVTKISKTGRKYKVGRLTVAYETSKNVTLEIGLSSWNKQTFKKENRPERMDRSFIRSGRCFCFISPRREHRGRDLRQRLLMHRW